MNNIDKKGLKNSKLLQMMFKKLLHTQLTFHQWEFVQYPWINIHYCLELKLELLANGRHYVC